MHSWIAEGDGGKREIFPSLIWTLVSPVLLICDVSPRSGGRDGGIEGEMEEGMNPTESLFQLHQLRIIVMHILLTLASILGTAYWSVTENLESNILNILIRFGSKILLKWIWMAMWCDTIWVFLLFGHRVGGCFGTDKTRILSEQSMLTLLQRSQCQISLGEILVLLTPTGTLPSTSRWHTFCFYLELA